MGKESQISLRQIAESLGLSRMTVSLALRNSPRVAQETHRQIQETARRLGYKPNPRLTRVMSEIAATRHAGRGEMLAYMTTERETRKLRDNFDILHGRASEHGYVLEKFWVADPKMPPARLNKILWARGVEGMIVETLSHDYFVGENKRTLPIEWDKFSVVECNDTMMEPALNRVRHEHFSGMILALEQLEALGYRRIGFCTPTEDDLRTHHRWTAGYLLWRTMRPAMKSLTPLISDNLTPKRICEWARTQRLQAVVAPGFFALEHLRTGGIDVPGDMGYASLDLWELTEGLVSGIDQEHHFLSTMVVDMLVMLIQRGIRGSPTTPMQWAFNGKWIDGKTTRPIKARTVLPKLDMEPFRL